MSSRTLTAVLVVALVAGVVLSGALPVSQDVAAQEGSYVVEQGEQCEVITPLSGEGTAAEFYDYRHHGTHDEDYAYSSHGTTHLQENDVSSIFLYEGPDGLSLVTVHDRLGGGTGGGAAEFEMVGFPAGSEWTVQDDDYSEHIDDVWRHGDVWSDVAWLWGADRTDGGVVTGLGEEFEVTIDPAFNDQQSTFGESEIDGTIEGIHVLSGEAQEPDRVPLASSEEPLVIRSGTCEDPTVQYDRIDRGIAAPVTDDTSEAVEQAQQGIQATVEDTGGEPVALRPPATGENGVQYDRLSIVAAGPETVMGPEAATIELSVEEGGEIPDSDDAVPLSALSVDTTEGTVEDAALTFGVEGATLDEHDATVNDVTVYEEGSDGWERVATEPVGTSDDVTQFRADASGDGELAVVLEESPITATELSLSEERIEAGESVEVTATVENTGEVTETGQVSLLVFGEVVDSREVTLDPGESETLTFEQRVDSPGSHTVEVAGASEQLEVEGDGAPGATDADGDSEGYLAIGVGMVVLLGLLVLWRRSPEE